MGRGTPCANLAARFVRHESCPAADDRLKPSLTVRYAQKKFQAQMLPFLFWACQRFSLDSGPGMRNFRQQLSSGDDIVLNISTFDFIIVFGEFFSHTVVTEHRSFLFTTKLSPYRSYIGSSLPPFLDIQVPFASYVIEATSDGTFSFSYGSLSGFCLDGVSVTNFPQITISMSSTMPSPNNLQPGMEKCILFTAQAVQTFTVKLGCHGKLIVHLANSEPLVYTGDDEFQFSTDGKQAPTLFRYLSLSESESISVTMSSEGYLPTKEWFGFYDPYPHPNRTCPGPKSCDLANFVDFGEVGWWSVIGFVSIIVLGFLVYVSAMWKCARCVQYSPQPRTAGENEPKEIIPADVLILEPRTTPRGYFSLDPVLRPNASE
jgi:hypothetical protein